MESEFVDLDTSIVSSDYEEGVASNRHVVQPFMYEPEASESSYSSCSDSDEESSASSGESSSRIGNTNW